MSLARLRIRLEYHPLLALLVWASLSSITSSIKYHLIALSFQRDLILISSDSHSNYSSTSSLFSAKELQLNLDHVDFLVKKRDNNQNAKTRVRSRSRWGCVKIWKLHWIYIRVEYQRDNRIFSRKQLTIILFIAPDSDIL